MRVKFTTETTACLWHGRTLLAVCASRTIARAAARGRRGSVVETCKGCGGTGEQHGDVCCWFCAGASRRWTVRELATARRAYDDLPF